MNEIYMMIIAVLIAALIITGLTIIRYRRQIREICRQLSFHREQETNQQIRVDVRMKEILALQTEINRTFDACNELERQYRHTDETLKDMITNLSHDIRTPLTSIEGYFQLLCETEDEEERRKYTEIIRSRIASLSMLLEQLFTYVRVQNGGVQAAPERCDVKQCLCETLLSFYEDFKQKGIEPKVELSEEPCDAYLDPALFARVLQNILKNALVHGDREITVKLSCGQGGIRLVIRNHTEEAHPAEPELVFERFYQGDKARNHQSSGLGLCIAKELIEQMGGQIRAYYEGAYFGIEILFAQMKHR